MATSPKKGVAPKTLTIDLEDNSASIEVMALSSIETDMSKYATKVNENKKTEGFEDQMDQTDEFIEYLTQGNTVSKAHRPSVTMMMGTYKNISPRPALGMSTLELDNTSEDSVSDDSKIIKSSKHSNDNSEEEKEESNNSDKNEPSARCLHKLTTLQRYENDNTEPFEWCEEFDDIIDQTHKEVFNNLNNQGWVNISSKFKKTNFINKYLWLSAYMEQKSSIIMNMNSLVQYKYTKSTDLKIQK